MSSTHMRERPAGRSVDFRAIDHGCPICGYAPLVVFYEVGDVPVHSCLMQDDRHAALEFPRGDISLGLCKACGFICNTRYDPKHTSYAENYEDQQTFSTTFNRFAQDLARDLVELYSTHLESELS